MAQFWTFFDCPFLWAPAALALSGCFGADLRKVHLPDLLQVDAKTAEACRPGESIDPARLSAPKTVKQIHASFLAPEAMLDGDPRTVAIVRDSISKDQYVLLDLGCVAKVRQIEQVHADPQGYAGRYRIDVAGDHNFPYEPVFVGCGAQGASIAAFRKPCKCRFLRLTLLEPGPAPWNIAELVVR